MEFRKSRQVFFGFFATMKNVHFFQGAKIELDFTVCQGGGVGRSVFWKNICMALKVPFVGPLRSAIFFLRPLRQRHKEKPGF